MISGYVLKHILGWKLKNEFPDIKKGIVIFAPHTSYMDALYGKLYFMEISIKHVFLSKKELFFFPMNIAMKLFGSIPIRNVKNNNAIYLVTEMLNNANELLIVISPEGTRAKVTRWNTGFYYIAIKANVPIVVAYLDYNNKEIGIKGVIDNLHNKHEVMKQIKEMYAGVSAKHPDKFSLENYDDNTLSDKIKGHEHFDYTETYLTHSNNQRGNRE